MAAPKKLSKVQHENLAAFRYALRKFLHFSEETARRAGITAQQHQALLAIKGFPGPHPVTIRDLAERLQLRHHSVVGLLDRLADLKLTTRKRAPADHRQVQVQLTAHGEQILEKLSATHEAQLRRIGPELSALLEKLRVERHA
ncbi:MAG TPA: helix-turn-helix domain-containing protein [Verrucomicrobiae bacterium]|jgi:DNA-binding MarR family transcriptional regulator|nr:helix-turn-helix domain-containing protein [Verrucomicrobiae bacterium]